MQRLKLWAALGAAGLLQACATTQPPIYSWGPYQDQVYAYFKGESPQAQIEVLEAHAQAARTKGQKLPPGFAAHLGLLYAKAGRDDAFHAALEQEMNDFPESAPYMNYLLKNTKVERKDAAK